MNEFETEYYVQLSNNMRESSSIFLHLLCQNTTSKNLHSLLKDNSCHERNSRSRIIAELIVPKAVQNKDITIEVLTLSYLSPCASPLPSPVSTKINSTEEQTNHLNRHFQLQIDT